MARRVFLHVGTMKSATSYIQDLLDVNRHRLAQQGVLWTYSGQYFLATDDLLGTQRLRPGLDGAWAALAEMLEQHSGDAVISNELLAPINARKRTQLVEALAPAGVHVVVSARDLGRVVPSQWQTGARNRQTTSWREFIAAVFADDDNDIASAFWRRQNVPAIVTQWAQQIPLENITVVTVPRSGVGPSVIGERFGTATGIDTSTFEQPANSNPSLGADSAELLRRLNSRTSDLDWLHYKWAFKNALARVVLAERAAKEAPITLSQSELEAVANRSRIMVDQLSRTGVRVVGDLADLIPQAQASGAAFDPSDAPAEQLLDTALDGLAGIGSVLADTRILLDGLVRLVEAGLPSGDEVEAAYADFAESEAEQDGTLNPYLRRARFTYERLAGSTKSPEQRDPTAGMR